MGHVELAGISGIVLVAAEIWAAVGCTVIGSKKFNGIFIVSRVDAFVCSLRTLC
jgi:hypothetical protein